MISKDDIPTPGLGFLSCGQVGGVGVVWWGSGAFLVYVSCFYSGGWGLGRKELRVEAKKTPKPVIMDRSSEACHSWQTHMSEPSRAESCTQRPLKPLCVFLPAPHFGWRLPLRAAWPTYPTCHGMKKARPSPSPNNARKTSKGHQSPLRRQYFPPILSRLSCPHRTPKALLSHTSSSFSPHKDGEPQGGVPLALILPRMAKGLPLWQEQCLATGGDICIPISPELWRGGEGRSAFTASL